MIVLDTKHSCRSMNDLPRDMSNLIKLRHFLVYSDGTHSDIADVGKLESLQELRRFVVKQEGRSFELRQIGQLLELCGSLCIANLENVQVKEEADEAKLLQKGRLHELILSWNTDRPTNDDTTLEEHVLERLKPSSNLLKLSVKGHRGATCPSWLGMNLSVKSLEYLCLDAVGWKIFLPIGELWIDNMPREKIAGNVLDKRFEILRRLELVNLPRLKKWAVHAPCQLFPFLEGLVISGCSQLVELSFSHSGCCPQEEYANLFPRLSELEVKMCPQLLSFPPVPWTEAPCSIRIGGTGSSFYDLVSGIYSDSKYLSIRGKDTADSTFWNVLAFHNLTKLAVLSMQDCQPLPLCRLQMLSPLRRLSVCSSKCKTFPFVEADSHVKYQFPVEDLTIYRCNASGKELTQLLTYFPKLTNLLLRYCDKITGLGVMGQQAMATPGPSYSDNNKMDEAQIERHQLQDAANAEGLLLLPPHLEDLEIRYCQEARIVEGGLQGLISLQKLLIKGCPKFLFFWSSSLSSFPPFPNSLERLELKNEVGMLVPLSNLSSLKTLYIKGCGELIGEGLLSLLAQGHLTGLYVTETPQFFVDSEPSQVHDHEQELQSHTSKLQELIIDDVAGFTSTTIRSLLFPRLMKLFFSDEEEVERFTEEQEALLFINSLKCIHFSHCNRLQYLPARLHRLPNLKTLKIYCCHALQMLPEDGLPSSLQELEIWGCPEIHSLPKDGLPSSLQKLQIWNCPRIQWLPKVDDLPSSLRELDVRGCGSEELKMQCRKLIGIIPIVIVY